LFDELDNSIEQDQLNSGMDIDYEKLNINDNFDCIGEQGQRIIEQMMEVENVVRGAGWLSQCIDGLPNVNVDPVVPNVVQNASKWKAAVESQKQKVLDGKLKNIPSQKKKRQATQKGSSC
jgi:hypothetical protein